MVITYTEQEVDGVSFLELTMDELNRLFPDKLGTVKKLYRLIQSVSYFQVWTTKVLFEDSTWLCNRSGSLDTSKTLVLRLTQCVETWGSWSILKEFQSCWLFEFVKFKFAQP